MVRFVSAPLPASYLPGVGYRASAAALLRAGGRLLDELAGKLMPTTAAQAPTEAPLVEYHYEAGAPEGALYVDGQLVGRLEGVQRL